MEVKQLSDVDIKISVNFNRDSAGKEFTLKLFLSGDYEFLCTIYGLSGATGT